MRTLVVLDTMGGRGYTADEEWRQLHTNWLEIHDIQVDATRSNTFSPTGMEADGCDLAIFDWGGASIGNDLLQHQVRWLIRWAEDHPYSVSG